MTAVFRDNLGIFVIDNIDIIENNGINKWLVFFNTFYDGGMEEYEGELLRIVDKEV